MKLVVIFGPQAVGKMTVGQELERTTCLKLFHNHLTIELVHPFISYGTEAGKDLVRLLRTEIFKAIASSDSSGIIFTFICNFDNPKEWENLQEAVSIFKKHGSEVYFVELEADTNERLRRNRTPNRLEHKPMKRDIELSERVLMNSTTNHRLNSHAGEIQEKNYIKIDNTGLGPTEVAVLIKTKFDL
jgi:shikimate kinase